MKIHWKRIPAWLWEWAQYGTNWLFRPWIRIRALEAQLKDALDVSLTGFHADGSDLDMGMKGGGIRTVAGMWVEFFHQNNGRNFVTMTAEFSDPWWKTKKRAPGRYEVTIRKVEGLSPAEKLAMAEAHIRMLEDRLGDDPNVERWP